MAKKTTKGPVEKWVMENIFVPEVLRERIPRMDEIQDGANMVRAMDEEISTVGKFRKATGFTSDRSMQRVAKIDSSLMLMLEDLHRAGCTCSNGLWGDKGHKQWFFDWLRDYGQAYDVRGKIVI